MRLVALQLTHHRLSRWIFEVGARLRLFWLTTLKKLDVTLPKHLAVQFEAILSDTGDQLQQTTEHDREYAAKLAKVAGISYIEDFGQQMLIAKSDLSHLSSETILTLDYKNFKYGGKQVGIGVAETLTAQQLIDRKDELLAAMKAYEEENGLDHLFFSITDTGYKRRRSYCGWMKVTIKSSNPLSTLNQPATC